MVRGNAPLGEIATNVIFENDKVKIWNLIVGPGEKSDWHMHTRDYLTIVLEGGGLTVEYDDGTSEVGQPLQGSWKYHDTHMIHRVVNKTDKTYKNLLIELKENE